KNIAILIAVLAALLAIAEMAAKSSQTAVLEAQHKDQGNMPVAVKAQIERSERRGAIRQRAGDHEGRKELAARATVDEAQRKTARSAYHHFEYGSAAFQLAIVLASAAAITSVPALAFVAGALGPIGAALTAL